MFCEVCGRQIMNEDANFCEYCGTSLREIKTGQSSSSLYEQNQPTVQGTSEQSSQPSWQGSVYQQMPQEKNESDTKEKPVSFLTWVGTLLLGFIPFVGGILYIVLLFVWAFGDGNNTTRKNWARATILVSLISLILVIILVALVISGVVSSGMTLDEYVNTTYY